MPWIVNIDTGELEERDTAGSIGAVTELQADTGTASGLIINVLGGEGINTTGDNAATLTISGEDATAGATVGAANKGIAAFNSSHFSVTGGFVSLVGGGTGIDSFSTDVSGPVSGDGSGNVDVTGTNIYSDGSVANTLTLNLQGTNHALYVGRGNNTPSTSLAVGTNGQVVIGATGADPAFASLTSSDSSITFTPGANTLGLTVTGGTSVGKTITGDTGGALSPTSGNWNLLGSGSITTSGSGSTLTTSLTGLTNHAVLVGAGTSTITKVGPTATSGQVLQSQGSSADPAFSTATYPATTTINQILYSSAADTVAGLATANNGTLATSATGVPSIVTLGAGQILIGAAAAAPIAANLTAGAGIGITNGTNSITINANPSSGAPVQNIGIAYSGGTFTVRGATATLSSTNVAYVTFPSKATPGNVVTVAITADQTFVDDSGSSTIAGNTFGFGTGDTIANNDVPFFLYAVLNDAENAVSFMISRTSGMSLAPAAANIGKTGSAVADVGFAFFALSDPTVGDYDTNPCVLLGSFRMRLTTAPGDWTVQTLSGQDGIGRFQKDTIFTLPPAILGAAANSHWLANGGTAPAWSTASRYEYIYRVTDDGYVWVNYAIDGDPSTDGVGAVNSQIIIPYQYESPGTATKSAVIGTGRLVTAATSVLMPACQQDLDYTSLEFVNSAGGGPITNAAIVAVTFNSMELTMYYPMRRS